MACLPTTIDTAEASSICQSLMAQLSKKTGPQAGAPAKAKAQAHTRCDLKHSPYTGGFEALAAPNACLMSNPRAHFTLPSGANQYSAPQLRMSVFGQTRPP